MCLAALDQHLESRGTVGRPTEDKYATVNMGVPMSFLVGGGLVTKSCMSRSVVSDSATSWNVACQAPLSMGFSRLLLTSC